jgi:hypothetical protein
MAWPLCLTWLLYMPEGNQESLEDPTLAFKSPSHFYPYLMAHPTQEVQEMYLLSHAQNGKELGRVANQH